MGYVNASNFKISFKKPRILYIAATDGRYGGAMAVGDGIEGVKRKSAFYRHQYAFKNG